MTRQNEDEVEHAHQVQKGEEMSLLLHGDSIEEPIPSLEVPRRIEGEEIQVLDVLLNMKKEDPLSMLGRYPGHRHHNVE